MAAFLSLKHFVNTWECDENDHMNVQFYFAKFDDANQVFQALTGLEEKLGRRNFRHVRYHSEMHSNEQIEVYSSITQSDETGTSLQHLMFEHQTGRLTATAYDHYEGQLGGGFESYFDDMDSRVVSRSLTHPVSLDSVSLNERRAQNVAMTGRGVVHPSHCGKGGIARDQAYISCVSDAASHGWDEIGIGGKWLEENKFGRIAVEMRLVIAKPLELGDLFELRTNYIGVRSKSFSKRYEIFNLRTGALAATNEVTAMILNHTTRRSEPVPDFAQEAIKKRII